MLDDTNVNNKAGSMDLLNTEKVVTSEELLNDCGLAMECEDDTLSLAQVTDYRIINEASGKPRNIISERNNGDCKQVKITPLEQEENSEVTTSDLLHAEVQPTSNVHQSLPVKDQPFRDDSSKIVSSQSKDQSAHVNQNDIGGSLKDAQVPCKLLRSKVVANLHTPKNKEPHIVVPALSGETSSPSFESVTMAKASTSASCICTSSPSKGKRNNKTKSNLSAEKLESKSKKRKLLNYNCNVVILGGAQKVNSETIGNVKVVSPLMIEQDICIEQKMNLYEYLENQSFTTDPLNWWYKCGIFDENENCVCGKNKLGFTSKPFYCDGYVMRCTGPAGSLCGHSVDIPRLKFFSPFKTSLSKLHRLVFHWAVKSDVVEILADVDVDIVFMNSVFSSIREICIKVIDEQTEKLGGPNEILELGSAQIGGNYVICVMNSMYKTHRLKVVADSMAPAMHSVIKKTVEPWLKPNSSIMTADPKMCVFSDPTQSYVLVDENSIVGVTDYLTEMLRDTFGKFNLVDLKQSTIQEFLYEVEWRDRFGRGSQMAFWNIIKDIAQYSEKKVTIPPDQLEIVSRFLEVDHTSEVESNSQEASLEAVQRKNVVVVSSVQVPPKVTEDSKLPNPLSIFDSPYSTPAVVNIEAVPTDLPDVSPPTLNCNLVSLAVYFYGKKITDNSPHSSLVCKIKCLLCHKITSDNISAMYHINAHLEAKLSGSNNDNIGDDLIQCKYCFNCFQTTSSMQRHIDKVHLNATEMFCRICHLPFRDERSLLSHMVWKHGEQEMPYVCQICNFRSSFYVEVLEHFQQNHRGANKLLCHFCLKIFNVINLQNKSSLGDSQSYYYHMYKHQLKYSLQKCSACCLEFLTINSVKDHVKRDHFSLKKSKGVLPYKNLNERIIYFDSSDQKLIETLRDAELKKEQKQIQMEYKLKELQKERELQLANEKRNRTWKKMNHLKQRKQHFEDKRRRRSTLKIKKNSRKAQPQQLNELPEEEIIPYTTNKNLPEVSCREVLDLQGPQNCLECRLEITEDHFGKQLKCKNCDYSTCCPTVMMKHYTRLHAKKAKGPRNKFLNNKVLFLKQQMMCSCGFNSFNGERLASHLVSCHFHSVSIFKSRENYLNQKASVQFQQEVSKRVKEHMKNNISTEKSVSLGVPVLENSNSALRNNGVNLEMLSLTLENALAEHFQQQTLGRAKKDLINQTSSMENASLLEVKDPIEEQSIAALQNETVNFEAISSTLENALAQHFHQEVKSEAVSIEKTTSFGLKRLLRENLSSTLENKSGKLGTIIKDKIVPHLQQKETSEKTTGHIKNEVSLLDKTPSLGIECLVKENSSLNDENFHSLQ